MSINCGNAYRQEVPGKPVVFKGDIDYGNITGDFYLVPHDVKRKASSPDYKFQFRSSNGRKFFHAGNAWVKEFEETDEETGEVVSGKFFSLTVDHEHLTARPLYFGCFPNDEQPEGGDKCEHPIEFHLEWSRPRAGNRQAVPAAGEAAPSLDDEIPW